MDTSWAAWQRESINRGPVNALVRLAPEELQMRKIPSGDLPLFSYDYPADQPLIARDFKAAIAGVDAVPLVPPEYDRVSFGAS